MVAWVVRDVNKDYYGSVALPGSKYREWNQSLSAFKKKKEYDRNRNEAPSRRGISDQISGFQFLVQKPRDLR